MLPSSCVHLRQSLVAFGCLQYFRGEVYELSLHFIKIVRVRVRIYRTRESCDYICMYCHTRYALSHCHQMIMTLIIIEKYIQNDFVVSCTTCKMCSVHAHLIPIANEDDHHPLRINLSKIQNFLLHFYYFLIR